MILTCVMQVFFVPVLDIALIFIEIFNDNFAVVG